MTRFSLGDKIGFASLFTALSLSIIDIRLSVVPLAAFLVLCGLAPFLPGFSFFLNVTSRGKSGQKAVSLTFDDGPDPLSTPALLHLLSKHEIKATFFVIGRKADEHPELIEQILSKGHSIGNHSYSHDNFIMLKSARTLLKEIESAQNTLKRFGVMPVAFRPPVGIINPKLGKALKKCGMYNVNFSCRAIDGGNRWVKDLSKRILKRVRPGDIILLHDVEPKDNTLFHYWLNEVESIFSGMKDMGIAVVPLSELIGKPVMIDCGR